MKKLPHSLEKVLKYLLNKRRTLKICLYISLMVVTLIGTSVFRTKKAIYVHIPEDDDIRLNEAIPPSQVCVTFTHLYLTPHIQTLIAI